MKELEKRPIYIIGSGNVAWHLLNLFKQYDIKVDGIWSRNKVNASELTKEFGCRLVESINELPEKGVFLLAVTDMSVPTIANGLSEEAWIIHTSGSVSLDSLTSRHKHVGVFYMLQTFTKGILLDYSNVPLLYEYSSFEIKNLIEQWINKLPLKAEYVDSNQRFYYHLAAVFVNNFVNFMLLQAENILNYYSLDKEKLYPLLYETISKAFRQGPIKSQTGPARRNDIVTIQKHKTALTHFEDAQKIYSFVSQIIIDYFNKLK